MKHSVKFITAAALAVSASMALAQSAVSGSGTSPVPSAKTLLKNAEAKAAKEHKSVFLIFHASWCIWCHRMDALLADPTLAPIFKKNFVVVHIDGMESKPNQGLENAGWQTMLTTYKGVNMGIPYWLFLSPKGKVLATCLSPNDLDKNGKMTNMGFPDKTQPADEDYFISDLKRAGAKISESDAVAIKNYLAGLSY